MSKSSQGRYTALVAKYSLKGPHPCLHALWSHQRLAAPEESHCHASLASLLPLCISLLPLGDRNCLFKHKGKSPCWLRIPPPPHPTISVSRHVASATVCLNHQRQACPL